MTENTESEDITEQLRNATPPGEYDSETMRDEDGRTEAGDEYFKNILLYAASVYFKAAEEHERVRDALLKHQEDPGEMDVASTIDDALEEEDPEREQEITDMHLSGFYWIRAQRYASKALAEAYDGE